MKKSRVRVFLLHRRLLAVLCTLAVAAGIFYVTLYPASQAAAASTRQLPIYSVERKEKLCSISFDAAWGDGENAAVQLLNCRTLFHIMLRFSNSAHRYTGRTGTRSSDNG